MMANTRPRATDPSAHSNFPPRLSSIFIQRQQQRSEPQLECSSQQDFPSPMGNISKSVASLPAQLTTDSLQSGKSRIKTSGANLLSIAKNILNASRPVTPTLDIEHPKQSSARKNNVEAIAAKHHKLPEDHRCSVIKRLYYQPRDELQQTAALESLPSAPCDSPLYRQPVQPPPRLQRHVTKSSRTDSGKNAEGPLQRNGSVRSRSTPPRINSVSQVAPPADCPELLKTPVRGRNSTSARSYVSESSDYSERNVKSGQSIRSWADRLTKFSLPPPSSGCKEDDNQWKRKGWRPTTTYVENLRFLKNLRNHEIEKENEQSLGPRPSYTSISHFCQPSAVCIQGNDNETSFSNDPFRNQPLQSPARLSHRTLSISSIHSESLASVSSKASRVLGRFKFLKGLPKSRMCQSPRYPPKECQVRNPYIVTGSLSSTSSTAMEFHSLSSSGSTPPNLQIPCGADEEEGFSDFDGEYYDDSEGDEYANGNQDEEYIFSEQSPCEDGETEDIENSSDSNDEEDEDQDRTVTLKTQSFLFPQVPITPSCENGRTIGAQDSADPSQPFTQPDTTFTSAQWIKGILDGIETEWKAPLLAAPVSSQFENFFVDVNAQRPMTLDKVTTKTGNAGIEFGDNILEAPHLSSEKLSFVLEETKETKTYIPAMNLLCQFSRLSDIGCFDRFMRLLSPAELVNFALTSKKIHTRIMQNTFKTVCFDKSKPSPSFICLKEHKPREHKIAIAMSYDEGTESGFSQVKNLKDMAVLCAQIRALQNMLFYTNKTGKKVPNKNSSFIQSVTFTGTWNFNGNWSPITRLVEELICSTPLHNLKNFKWDLGLPITLRTLVKLSDGRGSLSALRLNGFIPSSKILGDNSSPINSYYPSLRNCRPSLFTNFKNLIVLELDQLELTGVIGIDKKYVKEIFGVIVRSPKLRILKLGSRQERQDSHYWIESKCQQEKDRSTKAWNVFLPSTPIVDKTKFNTFPQDARRNQSTARREWIDMPVFDYELFKEASKEHLRIYETETEAAVAAPGVARRNALGELRITGTRENKAQPELVAEPYDKPLPSSPSVLGMSDKVEIRLKLKEVWLRGFALDGSVFNSPEFSPGSIETLSMINCCYFPPKQTRRDYNETSYNGDAKGSTGHALFLAKSVIKGLKVLRIDDGLLCSLGFHKTFDFLEEVFTPDTADLNMRQVYILPSTYPEVVSNPSYFISREETQMLLVSVMETQRNKSFIPNCEQAIVSVLALNPRWDARLETPELSRLIGDFDDSLANGLTELGVGLTETAWAAFLTLLPNLRKLKALHVYFPYCLTLPSIAVSTSHVTATSSNIPVVVTSHNREAQGINSTVPRQSLIDTKASALTVPRPGKTLNDLLANIPYKERARSITWSSVEKGHMRRRFPVDDADDIARAFILEAKAWKERGTMSRIPWNDYNTGKRSTCGFPNGILEEYFLYPTPDQPDKFGEFMARKGEQQREKLTATMLTESPVSLKYIGIGNMYWKLIKVPERARVEESATPVTGLTSDCGKWVLKRIFCSEADTDDIRIFKMGIGNETN